MNSVNYILFVIATTRVYNVNGTCSRCNAFQTQFLDDAIPNKALSNHVVKSLTNLTTKVQCFRACTADCRCMSYNFQDKPSTDGTQLCELNSADYKLDILALKNCREFTYYDIHPYFNSAQVKWKLCLSFIFFKVMAQRDTLKARRLESFILYKTSFRKRNCETLLKYCEKAVICHR